MDGLLLTRPSSWRLAPLLEKGFVVCRDIARSERLTDHSIVVAEGDEADLSLLEGFLSLGEPMGIDCDHPEDRASCSADSIYGLEATSAP